MVPYRWFHASLFLTALFVADPLTTGRADAPAVPPAGVLDRYTPEDTEFLVTVNVRQILDSDLFKKNFLEQARELLKGVEPAQEILKDLGLDPFKDVDRVTVTRPGGSEADRGLVIIHGRFDVAKFKARAETAARDNGDTLKVHKVPDGAGGQHLVYEVNAPGVGNEDAPMFVAVADKNTILSSYGKDYVVDALKKRDRKAAPKLKSKEFAALLGEMNPRQGLAIAVLGSALVKAADSKNLPDDIKGQAKQAKELLNKIDAIGGGVTISDEIKLEMVFSIKKADDARTLKDDADKALTKGVGLLAAIATVKKEFAPALEIIKSVRVRLKDKVLTVKATVSGDIIEDLLKMAK